MPQSIKALLTDEQLMSLTPGDLERLKQYGYSTEGLVPERGSSLDDQRDLLVLDRDGSRLAAPSAMEQWARTVERYEIPPLPERMDVTINGYRFSIPKWVRGVKVPLAVIEIIEEHALAQQKLGLLSAMYAARQDKPMREAVDLPGIAPRQLTKFEVEAGVAREPLAQE